VTLVDGTGSVRTIDEGDELRAARLGLGLLGVLTSVRLRVTPMGQPVRWSLRRVPADEFWPNQERLSREHEYLRMFEQHQAPGLVTWLAIDPTDEAPGDASFIERGLEVPTPLLGRLRRMVQGPVGSFVIPRVDIDTDQVVPFSADLFVKAGVSTTRFEWPTRLLYSIFNNDRTHNMEIGVPTTGLRAFVDFLHEEATRHRDLDWYWTGRFCGGSDATLLAPNRDRDTWFVDLHVTRESPSARAFLEAVGHAAISEHAARLHWGKVLVGESDELLRNHAPDVRERFERVRHALDPDDVFATEFGRRHLGIGG
jgi:L-gulonolactone oxidase